jgi:hypothetical protein
MILLGLSPRRISLTQTSSATASTAAGVRFFGFVYAASSAAGRFHIDSSWRRERHRQRIA